MPFEILESLSLPGDPEKPNEDAFTAAPEALVVFDGSTPLNDPLMPGKSDAAWIAAFGARRLMAHIQAGATPRGAMRHAIADAERSFTGLRHRAPSTRYEMPCASMIAAVATDGGFDTLWYGDCVGLLRRPGESCEIVGAALDKRAGESATARAFQEKTGLAPVEALKRPEHLAPFREGRAKFNTPGGAWLFSPVAAASEHASHARIAAPPGSELLLCTDGFLALVFYGRYSPDDLIAAAIHQGLKSLGEELRALENADPEGMSLPRFKPSDDATAVLAKLV
jgi:hypothetical protein